MLLLLPPPVKSYSSVLSSTHTWRLATLAPRFLFQKQTAWERIFETIFRIYDHSHDSDRTLSTPSGCGSFETMFKVDVRFVLKISNLWNRSFQKRNAPKQIWLRPQTDLCNRFVHPEVWYDNLFLRSYEKKKKNVSQETDTKGLRSGRVLSFCRNACRWGWNCDIDRM